MSDWYKVLVDGKACHGGTLDWSLPTDDGNGGYVPGNWHSVEPPIRCCQHGLHLTTDPLAWMTTGAMVYRAEGDGQRHADGSDKAAFQRARLLSPAPEIIPEWWQSWLPFVRDEIPATPFFQMTGDRDPAWHLTLGNDWAAARAAARAAAWAAAWDAAWAAAWDAAWDAARAAAWAAARDAARAAAWAAARAAAWDAARAAAWAAARAAAWDAARAAARDVAGAAAWDAALYAQVVYVCAGLELDPTRIAHARARWDVWQRGYGLVGDVDGVLYVYGVEGGAR